MNCSVLDCGAVVHRDRDVVVGDVAREVGAHHREAGQAESRAAHARRTYSRSAQRLVSRLATDRADRHDGPGARRGACVQRSIRARPCSSRRRPTGPNASRLSTSSTSRRTGGARCSPPSDAVAAGRERLGADLPARHRGEHDDARSARAPATRAGNGDSRDPVITPDCRYVAWDSVRHEPGRATAQTQRLVYRRDLQTGTNVLISRASGAAARSRTTGAFVPRMSADGNVVAFTSRATNLSDDDTHRNYRRVRPRREHEHDRARVPHVHGRRHQRLAGRRLLHVDLRRRALRRVRRRRGRTSPPRTRTPCRTWSCATASPARRRSSAAATGAAGAPGDYHSRAPADLG